MDLKDKKTGEPYRRLPAPVVQAEVDEYCDSLEFELSQERVRMKKGLTVEEIIARADEKRAKQEMRASRLWYLLVPALLVLAYAAWLFSLIRESLP